MACTPPSESVGGVLISASPFENARDLLGKLGTEGDPTNDEYEENVASGNNAEGKTGVQFPPPEQTSPPPEIKEKPEEKDDKEPPPKEGQPVDCDGTLPLPTPIDYNQALSGNFKLRDFTIGAVFPHELTDVAGYDKKTRFCNLKALSTNVAEAMFAKFGKFNINSGLRNTSSSKSVSQHYAGEAMDIQFSGWTYERYWENAAWIRDNIPYDQFIFEHSSKTGLAWYHLSFKRNGPQRRIVLTMYRDQYSKGLQKFG